MKKIGGECSMHEIYTNKIILGKTERKGTFQELKCRWENNIKIDIKI
jgi:hypothetical protein